MIYQIYMKSHSESSDWDQTLEASSKEEAAKLFAEYAFKYGADWNWEDLMEHIRSEDEIQENRTRANQLP